MAKVATLSAQVFVSHDKVLDSVVRSLAKLFTWIQNLPSTHTVEAMLHHACNKFITLPCIHVHCVLCDGRMDANHGSILFAPERGLLAMNMLLDTPLDIMGLANVKESSLQLKHIHAGAGKS